MFAEYYNVLAAAAPRWSATHVMQPTRPQAGDTLTGRSARMASRYEIRAGTSEHLEDLSVLAHHLNTVNLPDDPQVIRGLLETSEHSFNGTIKDPRKREYVFVLWDREQARAVGTSMIIAQL